MTTTTPIQTNPLQELQNIVDGFACTELVLKSGTFPGTISNELFSAIKFVEALKVNQQNVLDQAKLANPVQEEKTLDLKPTKAKKA